MPESERSAGRAGPARAGERPGEAPPLEDVLPWSVAPLRLGRGWVLAPDTASLRGRWDVLTGTADEAARAELFRPSRSRTLHASVAPLPGQPAHTRRLAAEAGGCPEPVPVLHGPFDRQWLIPDHRLIDAARPELWRVTDTHQTHLVETAHESAGPPIVFTTLLPDGHSPAGRPGRTRPFYRRPGGREPNLAPGLTELLTRRIGEPVGAEDVFAWTAAATRGGPGGRTVPFTADPELWRRGLALGRRALWLHTGGARGASGERSSAAVPRLPGGQRPYVRAGVPADPGPGGLDHDAEKRTLLVGDGRVSPVARSAWEYELCGGTRVLEAWYARRTEPAEPGTLAAVRPRAWPREWTSQLLELVTLLTLLDELDERLRTFADELDRDEDPIGRAELHRAGVLPPPEPSRRPASVLDLREEGPDGQLALL